MTRCYICDKNLDNDFKVGPDLKPEPCVECMEASGECLAGMDEEHKHVTIAEEEEQGFGLSPVPRFFTTKEQS